MSQNSFRISLSGLLTLNVGDSFHASVSWLMSNSPNSHWKVSRRRQPGLITGSLCLGTMAEGCTCNPTHGTVIKGSLKELPCYGYLCWPTMKEWRNEVDELNWIEIKWVELNWTEKSWKELNWIELKWIDLNWIELHWNELSSIELNWVELNWLELSWSELSWMELNWVELKWI
jgi:hypothetical protein